MTSTTVDRPVASSRREFVILGTEYAGEMKKGVFTIMNYLMPKQGVLSMHCSATEARDGSDTSILFGLSGTGKTTLSADPEAAADRRRRALLERPGRLQHRRRLLRQGASTCRRSRSRDIWNALRFGSVLENVGLRPVHARRRLRRRVDHREHARQLPPRHDPERQDPVRRRSPEERHLPDLRRVRRAAAGQPKLTPAPGDVPLHLAATPPRSRAPRSA